ncbi:MAG: hydantoinase/oxoprolinase family protein [Gammaproteobacteria bacterium]|nr:hydantoinase/oxoprolinase family protein [Gammaproteobacteria bacterium]
MSHVLGVDIGGTFTDFSLLDADGTITLWKEATTPKEPARAIQRGLQALAQIKQQSIDAFVEDLDLFVHGQTIATNTVIQRNGPKTALVCTEGFRDVLYFRDGYKPERYNVSLPRSPDFIRRDLRLPVTERVDYRGDVLTPLDESSVRAAAAALKQHQVESVAVALLWSVMNPAHELRVREILAVELPGVPVVLSSEVLPMIREWERTSSTVLSAYVLPGIARYMVELEEYLAAHGFAHNLLVMQLNGGTATVPQLLRRPIYALASGPAAGPAAGLYCAERAGARNIITIDMGGTSFDVCLVTDGKPALTKELRVHDNPVGVAAVDVHSIGAGGGSIAWIDKGGALQVGPESAGAEPGPACYELGGERPTVTDANVVLGYINPEFFLGGRRTINAEASTRAVKKAIAEPLGLTLPQAAEGIFRIVNTNMVGAIKVVSVEKGIDPRGYTLIVGGGAGAIHAGALARELGMQEAIVPRYGGVFCSYGMIASDVRYDAIKAYATNSASFDLARVNATLAELERTAVAELKRQGFVASRIAITRYADAKYSNQIHELTVPLPARGKLKPNDVGRIAEDFHALHERMFTYCVRESAVDFFHWRITAEGKLPAMKMPVQPRTRRPVKTAQKDTREVYFGEYGSYRRTCIYDGNRLQHGMVLAGPAVIETENMTIVVFLKQTLKVNRYGDFILGMG